MPDPTTRCVICSRMFPGYGVRGVCPICVVKYPAFIPRDQLSRTDAVVGPGYVFRSDGAVRYDQSASAMVKGDAPNRVWRAPMDQVFPHEPLKKRTPQQRLDSLHRRFAETLRTGVMGESLVKDIQDEQIASGQAPLSDIEIRQLAASFIDKAEKEVNAVERKLVTRTR